MGGREGFQDIADAGAGARGGATVREVLEAFPIGQRRALELGLAWMAKYGFVDWLT